MYRGIFLVDMFFLCMGVLVDDEELMEEVRCIYEILDNFGFMCVDDDASSRRLFVLTVSEEDEFVDVVDEEMVELSEDDEFVGEGEVVEKV